MHWKETVIQLEYLLTFGTGWTMHGHQVLMSAIELAGQHSTVEIGVIRITFVNSIMSIWNKVHPGILDPGVANHSNIGFKV